MKTVLGHFVRYMFQERVQPGAWCFAALHAAGSVWRCAVRAYRFPALQH